MSDRTLFDAAQRAAARAAAHTLTGFRTHPVFERKGRSDLVTRFDRESESILREELEKTGVAVVGEETGGDRVSEAFYVDPIDGTTNFVHGHPFYCVSVGLVREGVPVFGVVVAPALGITWRALVSENIAWRNDQPCRVSQTADLADSLLATGFPYDRSDEQTNNFKPFMHMKMHVQAIRRCGAAAIDMCLVADGTYDGYWERRLNPWDVAGGGAIVRGAGGTVTLPDGSAFDARKGEALATNGLIHSALQAELAKVL